jgi:hypothetical protein
VGPNCSDVNIEVRDGRRDSVVGAYYVAQKEGFSVVESG